MILLSLNEFVKRNNRIICTPSDIRNIRGGRISRIDTPGVNKDVSSPSSDTTSNFLSCTGSIEKLDTHVHRCATQERNLESSRIEEEGVKSIFPELGKELDPSVLVNLMKSVVREIPKFKSLGHPTIETADVWTLNYIGTTRAKKCNGLLRGTERDDRLGIRIILKL